MPDIQADAAQTEVPITDMIEALLRVTARLEAGGVVMAYPNDLPALRAATATLEQHERVKVERDAATEQIKREQARFHVEQWRSL